MYKIDQDKITASSLNRIRQHVMTTQCGVISAERTYKKAVFKAMGVKSAQELQAIIENGNEADLAELSRYENSRAENRARTKSLEADLIKLSKDSKNKLPRLGYIKVTGRYKEEGSTQVSIENSFFVFAIDKKLNLKDILIDLGYKYEQDSVVVGQNGFFELVVTSPYLPCSGANRVGEVLLTLNKQVWGKAKDEFGINLEIFSQLRNRQFAFYEAVEQKATTLPKLESAIRLYEAPPKPVYSAYLTSWKRTRASFREDLNKYLS